MKHPPGEGHVKRQRSLTCAVGRVGDVQGFAVTSLATGRAVVNPRDYFQLLFRGEHVTVLGFLLLSLLVCCSCKTSRSSYPKDLDPFPSYWPCRNLHKALLCIITST